MGAIVNHSVLNTVEVDVSESVVGHLNRSLGVSESNEDLPHDWYSSNKLIVSPDMNVSSRVMISALHMT